MLQDERLGIQDIAFDPHRSQIVVSELAVPAASSPPCHHQQLSGVSIASSTGCRQRSQVTVWR
jgi:hypothetical protein